MMPCRDLYGPKLSFKNKKTPEIGYVRFSNDFIRYNRPPTKPLGLLYWLDNSVSVVCHPQNSFTFLFLGPYCTNSYIRVKSIL